MCVCVCVKLLQSGLTLCEGIQNSLRFLFHFSASVIRDVSTVDEYILCYNVFPCQANDGTSCNRWYQMEEIILGWPKSLFGFFSPYFYNML